MYIYIYICIYIYIYIYIYIIYVCILLQEHGLPHCPLRLQLQRRQPAELLRHEVHDVGVRKGTNGVSTNGVTANFKLFDRGTFWVLPLICVYIPKSARAYLFPPSVKAHVFCSGSPICVDPICPQPRSTATTWPPFCASSGGVSARRGTISLLLLLSFVLVV